MIDRLTLGAPGIYHQPASPLAALTGVRLDVCAFAGVAPRGPARLPVDDLAWRELVPSVSLATVASTTPVDPARPTHRSAAVPVESWDEYRELFGSFEGPGLLPYAVSSFFDQGGRRAYVIRIVHAYGDDRDREGVAAGRVEGVSTVGGLPVILHARNEGDWGNRLGATLSFKTRPAIFTEASTQELVVPLGMRLPAGALLRLLLPGGARVLRFVARSFDRRRADGPGRVGILTLDGATSIPAVGAEVVEASLEVEDHDPKYHRIEHLDQLGLCPGHPRWMADVLWKESRLLLPHPSWAERELMPSGATLLPAEVERFEGGADRSADVTPEDFFEPSWIPGEEEVPGDGVHSLIGVPDVALLTAPDLYWPSPLVPPEDASDPVTFAGPTFARCVARPPATPQAAPIPELMGLRLDPELPADLHRIQALQHRLVELGEALDLVVLLDVPPRLDQRRIQAWRSQFDSSYAAAYHPWLKANRPDDARDALISTNPSAVAAGMIARREALFGIATGPANDITVGVVDVDDLVSPARHDELHQEGINVFLRDRDGIRLTAARTLSRATEYRQLTVRRLMSLLRRVLEQQMQWMVFEPNDGSLRASVRHLLRGYLRQLFAAGAFVGANESEAFFVRCDELLNPRPVVDAGMLVCEVGVAPSEPMEFLVIRISRDGDGTLRVEPPRG